jgi:hypothetical protein
MTETEGALKKVAVGFTLTDSFQEDRVWDDIDFILSK